MVILHIVHLYKQCVLKADGNILAVVFLASSYPFCVVPESSYSSNAESSSPLVAWASFKTLMLEKAAMETSSCSPPPSSCVFTHRQKSSRTTRVVS